MRKQGRRNKETSMRDVKIVAYIYRKSAREGTWGWAIMDRHKRLVLGKSTREFHKLKDVRKNFELITGLTPPSVPKGKDEGILVITAGLRSHVITYPFKPKEKRGAKT